MTEWRLHLLGGGAPFRDGAADHLLGCGAALSSDLQLGQSKGGESLCLEISLKDGAANLCLGILAFRRQIHLLPTLWEPGSWALIP